jgi:dihydrofolate reductase
MRKLIVANMVTVDGFFAGPHDEIDWHNVDEEFNEYALAFLDTIDTLVFGRVTYEGMASWWQTPDALADDPEVASKMNALSKVVFSRTLTAVDWQNSRLVKGDIADEMMALKQQDGKDMVIFGSGSVVGQLAERRAIDEFRVIVNPVVLGAGKSQFGGVDARLPLKLIGTQAFRSGNVLLIYAPGA